jgi:hypothetical protein
MAGEGPDLALVDDDQGAISVVLDLMKPASARWRLRDRDREFGLDGNRGPALDALHSISEAM